MWGVARVLSVISLRKAYLLQDKFPKVCNVALRKLGNVLVYGGECLWAMGTGFPFRSHVCFGGNVLHLGRPQTLRVVVFCRPYTRRTGGCSGLSSLSSVAVYLRRLAQDCVRVYLWRVAEDCFSALLLAGVSDVGFTLGYLRGCNGFQESKTEARMLKPPPIISHKLASNEEQQYSPIEECLRRYHSDGLGPTGLLESQSSGCSYLKVHR